MQRNCLVVIIMVICVCFLPLNANANKAGVVRTILKGAERTTKNHYYDFSRAGMAAHVYEKKYRRNGDSIYQNHLNDFRPICADSSISWDSLNMYGMKSKRPSRDLAPYRDYKGDNLFDNKTESIEDSVEWHSKIDTAKTTESSLENTKKIDFVALDEEKNPAMKIDFSAENFTYPNPTTNSYSEEDNGMMWKISLGLLILFALIICGCLKFFNRKGKIK